jgi:hypothetical protein
LAKVDVDDAMLSNAGRRRHGPRGVDLDNVPLTVAKAQRKRCEPPVNRERERSRAVQSP